VRAHHAPHACSWRVADERMKSGEAEDSASTPAQQTVLQQSAQSTDQHQPWMLTEQSVHVAAAPIPNHRLAHQKKATGNHMTQICAMRVAVRAVWQPLHAVMVSGGRDRKFAAGWAIAAAKGAWAEAAATGRWRPPTCHGRRGCGLVRGWHLPSCRPCPPCRPWLACDAKKQGHSEGSAAVAPAAAPAKAAASALE